MFDKQLFFFRFLVYFYHVKFSINLKINTVFFFYVFVFALVR